ncbi:MAG: type II secretion system minor pseudopilin GspI [Rhodanobacteraceae bacterium]|jgi:general secretion pathway protein I|nr:type II secretion system minor pseudopilin GspI [Rhodanobacteraceae bacterium]
MVEKRRAPHGTRHRSSDSPFPIPDSRLSSGFSLIEVLIALAVVALALLALTRAASVQVQAFDGLRERTLAGWVAANVLTETRLATPFPPTGRSDGQMRLAGRDWRWSREVQATPNAEIRRIDIRVFAGAAREPSASLTGFAGTAL